MSESLTHRATLKGHAGWVTAIATPLDPASDVLLTASRDKTVLVWHLEVRSEGVGRDLDCDGDRQDRQDRTDTDRTGFPARAHRRTKKKRAAARR